VLVLTRKIDEEIIIGDDIRISIVEIGPGRVKIGISAPRHVRVDRAEIHQQKMAETRLAEADKPQLINRVAEILTPETDATIPIEERLRKLGRIKPR